MGYSEKEVTGRFNQVQSEFMLSDLALGIFEDETYQVEHEGSLELIVFNKLDLILELNKKLNAN